MRGAAAGAIATWLMDLVTTGILQAQDEATTRREEAARPNGQSAVANLVGMLEAATGVTLDRTQREVATRGIHFGLGVLPGALYGAFRDRIPLLGAGRGVVYGVALWAVNDEYLSARLGLAGSFSAYPLETHGRGLLGHAVLGGATDLGIDLLGG